MENIEKNEEELNNDTTLEKNDIKSNQNKKAMYTNCEFTICSPVCIFFAIIMNA